MILEIYMILIAIGLVFLIISFFLETNDTTIIMRFLGTVVLFLMGIAMFQGNIEYKSGDNITLTGDTYVVESTYTSYQNHTIGFFVALLGVISFSLTFLEIRQARKGDEE